MKIAKINIGRVQIKDFEDCHHEKSYRTRDLTKLRQHSLTCIGEFCGIISLPCD